MNTTNPFDPMTGQAIADMVNAFLKWPLPESVSADPCATKNGKGRIGTNLLTMGETMTMLQEVVCPIIARYLKEQPAPSRDAAVKKAARDAVYRCTGSNNISLMENHEERLARLRVEVAAIFREAMEKRT